MRKLSFLLFVLIFIFVVQPDFRQNSLYAQTECVGEVDKYGNKYRKGEKYFVTINGVTYECIACGGCIPINSKDNTGNNESNSSIDLSSENAIKLTLIQAALNLIFGNDEIDNEEKERQIKEEQEKLKRIEAANERDKKLKAEIEQKLHNKLMALTKKLPGSEPLKEKNIQEKDLLRKYFDSTYFDGSKDPLRGDKVLDYKEIYVPPPGGSPNQEILNTLITQLDGIKLSVDSIKLKKTDNEKVIEEKKQEVEELTNKKNQTEDDQSMKDALLELEKAEKELLTAKENDEIMKEEIEKKEKLKKELEEMKSSLENNEKK